MRDRNRPENRANIETGATADAGENLGCGAGQNLSSSIVDDHDMEIFRTIMVFGPPGTA